MKKILMIAVMAFAAVSVFAQYRVEAGFLTTKENYDGEKADDAMNGIKLGGYYMLEDMFSKPIVLEAGLTFSMASWKEHDVKVSYSNVAIPINGGWKIEINDDFSVRPYAGINLKVNTSYKTEIGDDEYSAFDDGGDGRRFQFGGQLGGLVQWKQFTACYQFQGDMTSIAKHGDKVSMPNSSITVGYVF